MVTYLEALAALHAASPRMFSDPRPLDAAWNKLRDAAADSVARTIGTWEGGGTCLVVGVARAALALDVSRADLERWTAEGAVFDPRRLFQTELVLRRSASDPPKWSASTEVRGCTHAVFELLSETEALCALYTQITLGLHVPLNP